MLKSLLKYRKKAVNAHGIHSPFVFEFYNEVVKKSYQFDDERIREFRQRLRKDKSLIEVVDLGAGSKKNKSMQRTVADLTKYAAVSKKYGRLIGRIVEFYGLENCLELGTSMGVATVYMASNAKEVVTIEGCPNTFLKANKNFESLRMFIFVF